MKRSLVKVGGAVLCALGIVLATTAVAQRHNSDERPAGEQWEYLVVSGGNVNFSSSSSSSMRKESTGSFSREAFPLESNLDKLGAKGWELITIAGPAIDPTYVFKRRR